MEVRQPERDLEVKLRIGTYGEGREGRRGYTSGREGKGRGEEVRNAMG